MNDGGYGAFNPGSAKNFADKTTATLRVIWLNYQGRKSAYLNISLKPGASGKISGAVGDAWQLDGPHGCIGEFMARYGLADSDFTVTTAAGIHARPLAEFVLFALLYFVKDAPGLADATPPLRTNGRSTAQAPTTTLRIGLITPREPFMAGP